MKRKIAFLTVLLSASATLIFLSAPKAKACPTGGGDKQFEYKQCFEFIPSTGEIVVTGEGNNCPAGQNACSPNDC